MLKIRMHIKKQLNADYLFSILKEEFEKIPDWRNKNKVNISISDSLMSNFAIFFLKDKSLLQFEKRLMEKASEHNLKSIFNIDNIPSDTSMREINDVPESFYISNIFKEILRPVQRGKVLQEYIFLGKYYLIAMDGTGYFSSDTISCDNCQIKIQKKKGAVTYSHAMLQACIVNPKFKEVFPIMSEAIIKQDGSNKNDCERNAGKRLLEKIRSDHPKFPIIIVEDALASNMPHIRELKKNNMRFILGVKPKGNKFLFNWVEDQAIKGNVVDFTINNDDIKRRYRFINNAPLNESNQDSRVNFFEYWGETKRGKRIHFSWITDIEINRKNVKELTKGGRARWKIENETFNTLKNQGYNFEHNYGHGYKNLSVNMVLLMMLAFLINQIQQKCCKLFQTALEKEGRKIRLWETIRCYFKVLHFESWQMLLESIVFGLKSQGIQILYDSS